MENNTQLQSNNSPITSEITERLNKFFTNETKIKDFIQILREYNKIVVLLSLSPPAILRYAEDVREGHYWANLFTEVLDGKENF